MTNSDDLPRTLKNKLFTLSDAREAGLDSYKIKNLLAKKIIERLGRGIYRSSGGDIAEEEQFCIATLWIGQPSAICLLSALAYYHLTDEIPRKTWIMVPHAKLSRHQDLCLVRVRNPNWELGIEKHPGFWITDVARTVVDSFAHPQIIGTQVAVESLRKAVENKLTSIRIIYDMAMKLHVHHRISPYVELLP